MCDVEDDFIGKMFPTPKGGVLTVVGHNGLKSGKKKYILECSICSRDEELWPYGSITSSKPNMNKRAIPCGCSVSVKWDERQQYLRVNRLAMEEGYTFIGWHGGFKGIKTYIDLYNPLTGNRWDTCKIESFLSGARDPALLKALFKEKKELPDEYHINNFKKNKSLENLSFKKNKELTNSVGSYVFWDVTCPICSNDEYAKNVSGSDVFHSSTSQLRAGYIPCRCSKSYQWRKEERLYTVKKICKSYGYTFIKFLSEKVTNTTKLNFRCDKGHEDTTSVVGFINNGVKCKHCNESSANGFYPKRSEDLDTLYVVRSDFGWIKCGRTFNLSVRMRKLKTVSKSNIEILKCYTGRHKDVYKLEQLIKHKIHSEGDNYFDKPVWHGSTECYKKNTLPYIISTICNSDDIEEVR